MQITIEVWHVFIFAGVLLFVLGQAVVLGYKYGRTITLENVHNGLLFLKFGTGGEWDSAVDAIRIQIQEMMVSPEGK